MSMLIKSLAIATFIFIGISSIYWWPGEKKDDNPVEQICEKIIEEETGFDIDLSPEKKQRTLDQLDMRPTTVHTD